MRQGSSRFDPNVKLQLLQRLKDKIDVVICIYSGDIERKKTVPISASHTMPTTLRIIDNLPGMGYFRKSSRRNAL